MGTIIGLLASPADAESTVNNLTEQGIGEHSISVVLANEGDARAIIPDGGPLRGATVQSLAARLSALGVAEAEAYQQAVSGGSACVAVAASGGLASSAQQTLAGYQAQLVQEI